MDGQEKEELNRDRMSYTGSILYTMYMQVQNIIDQHNKTRKGRKLTMYEVLTVLEKHLCPNGGKNYDRKKWMSRSWQKRQQKADVVK